MLSAVGVARLGSAGIARSEWANARLRIAAADLRIRIPQYPRQVSILTISGESEISTRCLALGDAGSWRQDFKITEEKEAAARNRLRDFLLSKTFLVSILACVVSLHCQLAYAAARDSSSIGTSSLGLRMAAFLRRSKWPDEAIVFALATLPVLELRGAIPVGYWMQLDPLKVYCLAVAGNIVIVPLVLLYLEKFTTFLATRSSSARKAIDSIYNHTRRKAGPIEEFKWLGLMLFVAVPLPGTGAWTGAIACVVLGMPFWSSFWANFFGVAIAGILVNLLVSLGFNTALLVGAVLFAASTFMWSFLRLLGRSQH